MSTSGDLFSERRHAGQLVGYGPARARSNDGGGSRSAARKHERTGRAGVQRLLVLEVARKHPGRTGKELARIEHPSDELAEHKLYEMLRRRLPELRDGSPPLLYSVPPKGVRGRSEFRWFPCEE